MPSEELLKTGPGFSGADFKISAYIPNQSNASVPIESAISIVVGDISTLNISSHRGISQVRRLGTSTHAGIARGMRTYGGSMIFSFINQSTIDNLIYGTPWVTPNPGDITPVLNDMLPPMTISILGTNEYGHMVVGYLFGVVLIDSGVTLSIENLRTESTYTYVASYCTPITTPAVLKDLFSRLKSGVGADRKLGDTTLWNLNRNG